MTDTSSRFFGIILILVAVWIGTYWLWEPSGTKAQSPGALAQVAQDDPLSKPLPSQSGPIVPEPPRTDLVPLPVMEPAPEAPKPAPLGSPLTRRVQKRVEPKFREYTVQKGDVSWRAIAARKEVYGDGRLADAVSKANPLASSDRLKPGVTKLKIALDPTNIQGKLIWVDEVVPDPAGSAQASASNPTATEPAKTSKPEVRYTIERDDTLWSIAKKFYGRGNDWRRIYDANKSVIPNPDRPAKGVTIIIPDAPASSDAGSSRD